MLIEGVFTAVTTPFYSDEKVYLRKLEANIARYSRSQLAGMLLLGSTGEAAALNDAESCEVLRVAAETAVPDKVLIAGVGRESVKATVEMAEIAAQFKYDAVLVRPPTSYTGQLVPLSVLHYFRAVADRSPLPILLCNTPAFDAFAIPVELVAELAHHPNIIGIKDITGNIERIRALIAATSNAPRRTVNVTNTFEAATARMRTDKIKQSNQTRSNFVSSEALGGKVLTTESSKIRSKEVGFQVLTGATSTLLESLEAGASGGILSFAACAPQACQEIYLAWKDHDLNLALEKQKRVAAPSQQIVGQLGISGIKYASDFNGYYGGRARLPQLSLTAEEKAEIEGLLKEIRA